jgi:polysaccharide export outer membrane protein
MLIVAGCGSLRKVAYVNDVDSLEKMPISMDYQITIQPLDFLSIVVNTENALDRELALAFNGPMSDSGLGHATIYTNTKDYERRGYLVDSHGNINFPILGTIHVQNMTRDSLITYLERRISDEGYLKSPMITANIQNIKIAVLGEVARPGQFGISTDRITIFDGLSMAGDMTIYGNRQKVKVIREVNGERIVATLNLNSKDIFDSPYFYLRQNDVVYVEPNKRKAEQGSISPLSSLLISSGSLLVSIASLVATLVIGSR